MKIVLLAEVPAAIDQVATMQWKEWGDAPGRDNLSWWIEVNTRNLGWDEPPLAFVAVEDDGVVLGNVTLDTVDRVELSGRGPWVQGMIVREELRGHGVGHALLRSLETWCVRNAIPKLWVCNEGPAVAFYERCGWRRLGRVMLNDGDYVTVLTKTPGAL